MRASKRVLRCIPPHTGIFFFSPRDQLLLSGLVFDVNSPIAGHQQPQEHTGLQMRHAGLDTLHHFCGRRKENGISFWSELLRARFPPLFWLRDKIWEGSLHIAVIKYLLFKEDSRNFLKLMASSLCLDSTTSIEPFIELFAQLFYYR